MASFPTGKLFGFVELGLGIQHSSAWHGFLQEDFLLLEKKKQYSKSKWLGGGTI
jgi:hypothetical protein